MPEYIIQGRRISTPKPLTDAEIDDIAKDVEALSAMQPTIDRAKNNPAPSTPEYLTDRLKRGVGEAVSTIGHAGSLLSGGGKEDKEHINKRRKQVEQFLGTKYYTPDGLTQQYLGAGAEALPDPLNYIGSSGILNGVGGTVLPAILGEAGRDVAEKAGFGGVGQTVGGIVGGVAGGVANASLSRAGRGISAAVKYGTGDTLVSEANRRVFSQAEQHVQNTLKAAVQADPEILKTIRQAQIEARQAGVNLPVSALADNPVLNSQIRSLAARDPAFAAIYNREWKSAAEATKQSAKTLFGDPVDAKQAMTEGIEGRITKADRLRSRLDFAAKELSNPTGPTPTKPIAPSYIAPTLSGQLENKLLVKEGAISPKSIPLWEQADEEAAKAGTYLSEGSVMGLWRKAAGELKESPYERFPSLFEKVKKVAAPIVDPKNPSVKQWNPAPYEEVRSLQRAISSEYSTLNPNSPTYRADRAALSDLRKTLDDAMERDFPKEVLDPLKAAGKQYAYDVNLRDLSKSVFNSEGILDPKKLETWLKDENNVKAAQNLIDPSTGKTLGETVADPAVRIARILERKDRVDSIVTEMAKRRIADLSGMPPSEIINKLYSDDKFVTEVLSKYGKNKQTLNAMRSYLLDDIMNSKEPLKTLLEDKNKASTYNRVFGPGYSDKVETLARIQNRLQQNPADVKFDLDKGVNKDWLDEKVGVSAAMVFSKIRNPIISKWQALVELSSKAMTGKVNSEYERRMKQVLLSPEGLSDYLKIANAAESGKTVKQADVLDFLKKYGLGEAVGLAGNMARGGIIGANQSSENE